jgi:1-acyl-sn-glycerol-3-phosphate acyltransferase
MRRTILVACIRALTGATSRWLAPPPDTARQCIYFANHTSNLDAVVLWASLPAELRHKSRPVAARDYWEASTLRRYLASHVFHAVLIDRTKVTVQNNPIKRMLEAMGNAYSLIIFPEGGRSLDEHVRPFKSGLFHLAQHKPDAALIPVYIDNLNRILPKGEFLPVPLLSSISFGEPLPPMPNEPKAAFLERARQAVCDLNPNAESQNHKPVPKRPAAEQQ